MFALLDRQSFVRSDGSRTDATATDPGDESCVATALSSVIRSIPAARGGAAGSLFTPADGVPAAQASSLSVLVVAGDGRRDTVARALTTGGASHVVEAGSCAEARERVAGESVCDLAVVDLGLADGSALELVGDLRDHGLRTVVLSGRDDDPADARAAIQAGALALLLTSTPSSPAACGPRVPTTFPSRGVDTERSQAQSAARDLSDREIQVLQCVADGRSNIEIGEELNLSALTVKSHLSRIGRKLGIGDRAGMVAVAMRAYLVH